MDIIPDICLNPTWIIENSSSMIWHSVVVDVYIQMWIQSEKTIMSITKQINWLGTLLLWEYLHEVHFNLC